METKKLKKILAIIFCICLAIYFAYAVILLIIHPTEIYVITKGEIKEEEETVGYIIRNETVIKDEDNLNGIYAITTEGQKVAKDEVVFRYYKESEKETTENIKKIDYEIQEELEKDKTSPSSADIKVIENQIEEKLIELNKEELCRCFKGAYRNALYNILITKYIPNSIGKMMDLFNPDVDNLPSHVTKKLVKHPNLLHFFEDRNV